MTLDLYQAVKSVYVHDDIYVYIADIAQKPRTHKMVELGIYTRGILPPDKMACAYCAVNDQDFVTPKRSSLSPHSCLLSRNGAERQLV